MLPAGADRQHTVHPPLPLHSIERERTTTGMTSGGNRKLLAICCLGILVCYFYYGVLQEKITKEKYGEEKESFTYTLSLVFIQCIINVMFAKLAMSVFHSPKDSTPKKMYAVCSLTYLGAMLASNHSLQHINYPTQVLGKSVKPIPVMVLGVLFAKKRYPAAKYLCVLMIVAGVAMFMYKERKEVRKTDHIFGIGEMLLLLSLTLDGLTGASQERMRTEYSTSAHNLMLNVNLFSVLWLAIGLIVTGEGLAFVGFVHKYPYVLVNMMSFSIASAVGQTFIFITVISFGPLTCSIITTTRKFFTILGSVILFQNPLSGRQWIGTVLVFLGLGLDSFFGKEKKKK